MEIGQSPTMMHTFIAMLPLLIWTLILVLGVITFVLFVKLATRGIKALDLYIEEKTVGNSSKTTYDPTMKKDY